MSNFIFVTILIQLLVVTWIDLRDKKISNYWVFINIALSISFHLFIKELYPLSWEILIFPIGFIAIGFFLFVLGIMGAGDSKYLASLCLVIPLNYHLAFLEKLIVSTLIVGFILLSIKIVKNFSDFKTYLMSGYWSGLKSVIKSRFSYAPVILLTWILVRLT